MDCNDIFSGMYITYYHGGLTSCTPSWKAIDTVCAYSKFYYITAGECAIDISGTCYHGKAGDMFLIPSGVKHSFYHINDNLITHYWYHFDFKSTDHCFVKMLKLPYMASIGSDDEITGSFNRIFHSAYKSDLPSQLRCKSEILKMLSVYMEITNKNAAIENVSVSINGILGYINDNLDKCISLHTLAERACLHPNYFIRIFKENIGISPIKYINKQRLEHAETLLKSTDLTISEIMVRVGFKDLGHFSKFFKSHVGCSPTRFREFFQKI